MFARLRKIKIIFGKKIDKLDAMFSFLFTIRNYYRFPKEGEKIFQTKEFKIFKILEDLETPDFILY